jgi:hypothetical protein
MERLYGVWRGTGTATYPTIEAARYRDELTFRPHAGDPITQVEQKTWRLRPDGTEALLHWEFGFIRQIDGAAHEWINAQNNGRVEVMKGTITTEGEQLALRFESVAFANDPRMSEAAREVTVSGDTLRYTMTMATQAHPASVIHLEAELRRSG